MIFFAIKDLCIPEPPSQMTLPGGHTGLRLPAPRQAHSPSQYKSTHHYGRYINNLACKIRLDFQTSAYCPFLILVIMTDFFAQSLQAFQERMRTPWIGSILIASLLWNWQPLLFLVASDTALVTRFTYFESHTGWCSLFVGPVIAGFLFAAAKPWISLVMDWLGAQAIHQSRLHADRLAEDRSSKRLDFRAELLQKKAEIENEIVDHAIERKTKI